MRVPSFDSANSDERVDGMNSSCGEHDLDTFRLERQLTNGTNANSADEKECPQSTPHR